MGSWCTSLFQPHFQKTLLLVGVVVLMGAVQKGPVLKGCCSFTEQGALVPLLSPTSSFCCNGTTGHSFLGPVMGVGKQQGPLPNALQFKWETGMDMLCRNLTGWQHPLEGEVTSRPAGGAEGIRELPGPGSRGVQGRRDVPGHPTTTSAWSCHHCRGPWGVLFECSLLKVSLREQVGVQGGHTAP